MHTSKFNYFLPKKLIAQSPVKPRDHSRLMVVDRKTGKISHHFFYEVSKMLGSNDVLVLNRTKVFPARFFGKKDSGGKIEVLLIEEVRNKVWKALTRPGLRLGHTVVFKGNILKAVGHDEQTVLLRIDLDKHKLLSILEKYGRTPLPPYISPGDSETELRKEYQTVYAQTIGSVAAPTAGFHFTKPLLSKLKRKGVQIEYVTLHVGLGTFAPIKTEKLEDHPIHFEHYNVDKTVFERLKKARKIGKRIIAVGTTSTRVLETIAIKGGKVNNENLSGSTNLFIYPPYRFKFVDAIITNFHLPSSTLLALVSAFVSHPNTKQRFKDFEHSLIGKAYFKAIKKKYRFYSFGDACFIL